MKDKSILLLIAGAIMLIAGIVMSFKPDLPNAVDSSFPYANIAGTVPQKWLVMAAGLVLSIGGLFYVANPKKKMD